MTFLRGTAKMRLGERGLSLTKWCFVQKRPVIPIRKLFSNTRLRCSNKSGLRYFKKERGFHFVRGNFKNKATTVNQIHTRYITRTWYAIFPAQSSMESKPQPKKRSGAPVTGRKLWCGFRLNLILQLRLPLEWSRFQLSRVAGIVHGELHTSLGPISFCVPLSGRFDLVFR